MLSHEIVNADVERRGEFVHAEILAVAERQARESRVLLAHAQEQPLDVGSR